MRELDLETLVLESGAHKPNHTFCVMEAVAFIAGEEWSDHPVCACPVVSTFLRKINDLFDEGRRQNLKQFIVPLINSKKSLSIEIKRARYFVDWCQQFKFITAYAADAAADAAYAAATAADAADAADAAAYAAATAADAAAYAVYAAADAADAAYAAATAADAAAYAVYAATYAADDDTDVVWNKIITCVKEVLLIK